MLHVIGLGVQETAVLEPQALEALHNSMLIIGSERQLKMVEHQLHDHQQKLFLPKLSELKPLLQERLDNEVQEVVSSISLLASGDPLFFGIGKWLTQHFQGAIQQGRVTFYPGISSIQATCHRLGWSLQDVEVLSLHGRPVQRLSRYLKPNVRLLILTDKYSQPATLARYCVEAGFPQSQISVCEKLGYSDERVTHYSAGQLLESTQLEFDSLQVSAIHVKGVTAYRPAFPGFSDHLFITDKEPGKGMLTKREVRLAILSLLSPQANDCLWDVGAGCGGVSVESAYWAAHASVFSIEHHASRLSCLNANRTRFGVEDNLHVIEGRAPNALEGLPKPNKIFVGGSDGALPELLTQCWNVLEEKGVLVASAVTESTRLTLLEFYQQRVNAQDSEADIVELSVRRSDVLAGELLMRPQLPVQLFSFIKRTSNEIDKGAKV